MRPPEQFRTRRLRLRPVTVDDAEPLFEAYANDPQATRFLSWRTHETVDETREFLVDARAGWQQGNEYIWALVAHPDDTPIGALGAADTPHGVEIGFVLGRRWWGQGLMSEALDQVMTWLRDRPEVHRIWAYCAVDHVRSASVLERSGMTYEGTLRRWVLLPNLADEPCDVRVYSWVPGD